MGTQVRAQKDLSRAKTANALQTVGRIVAVVVAIILVPVTYRLGGKAYYSYRLNSMAGITMKGCGGPVTANMTPYEKEQVEKCVSRSPELKEAQANYDNFMGTGKSQQPTN